MDQTQEELIFCSCNIVSGKTVSVIPSKDTGSIILGTRVPVILGFIFASASYTDLEKESPLKLEKNRPKNSGDD